ncbi:hypothetical protein ZWY2020_049230 [Hordeum vulgare]|nr:hypothetical protein ZWY2020_049230 [Hordeum vulgare]
MRGGSSRRRRQFKQTAFRAGSRAAPTPSSRAQTAPSALTAPSNPGRPLASEALHVCAAPARVQPPGATNRLPQRIRTRINTATRTPLPGPGDQRRGEECVRHGHGHYHRRRGPKITRRPHKSLSHASLPLTPSLCPEIRPATPPVSGADPPTPPPIPAPTGTCHRRRHALYRPAPAVPSRRGADRHGATPGPTGGCCSSDDAARAVRGRVSVTNVAALWAAVERRRERPCLALHWVGTEPGPGGLLEAGGGFEARMLAAAAGAAKIVLLPSVHGR